MTSLSSTSVPAEWHLSMSDLSLKTTRSLQHPMNEIKYPLQEIKYITTMFSLNKNFRFMISTIEVVILGKVAELARRYGLKLSDSIATLSHTDGGKDVLEFPAAPTVNPAMGRFGEMTEAIGIH